MTTNQVQYWNLRESARHNREMENLGYYTQAETVRHNLVTEQQGWTSLNLTEREINERVRHNLVTEDQGQQSINETVRHNKAQETIGFGQIRATVAAASISAAAHRYAAEQSANASMYSTDVNAFISQRSLGIQQEQARYAGIQASAAQTNAEVNAQLAPSNEIKNVLGGVGSGVAAGVALNSAGK